MHYTELPKWVGSDAVALFAKEMRLTKDELDRAEWTDTDEVIDPGDTSIDWEEKTVGNWWVTVDLKAFLFWVAFTDPDNSDSDTYLWQQVCQGCGQTRDDFSTSEVETSDGRVLELPLCDKICSPDQWDDFEPGEWGVLDQAYVPDDGKLSEVRLKDWMCEHCSSMCPHGMMNLMLDNDYDPPAKALVCSNCQKKERGRFIAFTRESKPNMIFLPGKTEFSGSQ